MAATAVLPPHLSRFGLLGFGKGRMWSVVVLESVAAEVQIRGFVAQVLAKLVYHNDSAENLQVQAVFPVDEGAAVYHCEAHLGGRTIVTHCTEKKKAEKMYDEAVRAGHQAVMAREHDDTSDILKLNLGNLPAESRAEITLKMVLELKVETDGGISFVLPSVLNPRYSPAVHQTGGLFGHPHVPFGFNPWFGAIVHVPKPYSIEVKASVSGSHKIARVVSGTDPVVVTLADDALSAQVSQDGGFRCDHDWSFSVYYNNPYKPHLLRETGDRSATGIMKDDLLMLNFFPEVPENTYSCKNEIIFVVDRSGSMQGHKILSAKNTLLLFLKSLPAGCLFNVVSFGSVFSVLFTEGSRMYKEDTLKMALNLQATMGADMGGTEILLPLQYIYSKPPTPGYSRQIILITDGEVWNVDQVLQLVARHAHEARLFAVGVGHGASTALVHGAARAGRGRSEMVAEESQLQQKVMGLVASMVQESVQEVTIACEVEPASRVTLVPKVPPIIFGGQHLTLYARVPATTQVKSVTVRGQLGATPLLSTVEGQQVTTVHDEAKSLHRLAARAQLQQWQLDEEEDVAEDMVALSTASGVVCRRTALIGIDKESGKPFTQSPAEQAYGTSQPTFGATPMVQMNMMAASQPTFGAYQPSSGASLPWGLVASSTCSFKASQATFGASQSTFGGSKKSSLGGPQPTSGGSQFSFGASQPTFGGSQFSFGASQPTTEASQSGLFGASQSSFGAPQPTSGGSQFSFGAPQPTVEPSQSALFGASQSSFGAPQPTSGGSQFSFGASQPATEASQSALFGASQSSFGAPHPTSRRLQFSFGASQPTTEASQSALFGASQSSSGASQPTFGASQSTFGASQSTFGASQSTFGASQSSSGASQPTFGASQPTFGPPPTTFASAQSALFGASQPTLREHVGQSGSHKSLGSFGSCSDSQQPTLQKCGAGFRLGSLGTCSDSKQQTPQNSWGSGFSLGSLGTCSDSKQQAPQTSWGSGFSFGSAAVPSGAVQVCAALPERLRKSCNTANESEDVCEDVTSRSRQSFEESLSPPAEEASGLLGVVSLQQFDGSWTLEDAAKLTDVPLDALSASNPAKSEAAWATALVLVLLERKFGERKVEWTLLATKAQTFITGCGEQVEDLLAKARSALPAK